MIGKPEWFARRKYTGWGLTPKTWQGWVYVAVLVVPFAAFNALPYWSTELRTTVLVCWLIILGIDVTDIMIRLKKDEREHLHEAVAERNAAWFMVMALAVGIIYYSVTAALTQRIYFEPFMMVALIGGFVVKAISNLYLERTA